MLTLLFIISHSQILTLDVNFFMLSLLIDTSSNRIAISLNNKDGVVAHKFFDSPKELSSTLFPSIVDLFNQQGITSQDLSFLSLGIGPGSYTGLRIGASVIKALSYALKIPIVSFGSLKCFIPKDNGSFLSVMDAKSSGLYLLKGIKSQESIIYKSDPLLLPYDSIQNYLDRDTSVVSPHIEVIKEKFSSHFIKCEKYLDCYPDLTHLAKLVYAKKQNNNFNLFDKLNLLYLRGPSPLAL
jgi:tRNA threonylcarbamoyladenosine biosynthesis protein TsaB